MLLAEAGDRSALMEEEESRRMEAEAATFPGAVLAPLVPCTMRCGEMYCSQKCREEHWDRGHRLLCVGHIPEHEAGSHPLVQYKMHALRTNEIFLLVADVVALVLTRFESNGGDLSAALSPFRDFVQRPWWDVATNPDPVRDTSAFQDMLRGLVKVAADLLRQALLTHPGAPCATYCGSVESIVSPDFVAAVIGMFEQNNVGIRRETVLSSFLVDHLMPNCTTDSRQVYLQLLGRILEDWEEGEEEDEEGEEGAPDGGNEMCVADSGISGADANGHEHGHHQHLGAVPPCRVSSRLPPASPSSALALVEACLAKSQTSEIFSAVDGTALLSLICCMNHSCQANCEVRWVGGVGGAPLMAELVAMEHLPGGGELFQSYIRVQGTSVEDRRTSLKEYGFICQCALCSSGKSG